MKHELDRLGSDGFEHLIQAVMSKLFGVRVKIYGDGPDRQREAVIENAHHQICGGVEALGRTIVQAKFKSPDGKQNDWVWLRQNLKKELDGFAEKAKKEPSFLPNTWLFFTNVFLTSGKGGVKDCADEFVSEFNHLIPHIYILGADEIRSLLDANPEIARRYAAFLTPGDMLKETFDYLDKLRLKPLNSLMEYVRQRFKEDEPVRLEQAGNVTEGSIAVRNVYIDLEAEAVVEIGGVKHIDGLAATILRLGDRPHTRELSEERATHIIVPENNLVLIGNAGQGKSTFCQFICQLYRASLLKHYRPEVEAARGYAEQSGIKSPECERFPVLIRLKEYAAWIKKRQNEDKNVSLLLYLLFLFEKDGIELTIASLQDLLKGYSWVFFFDGLDEVPASSNRTELLRQIDIFLSQDLTEARCDSLVICTSRPQGYDSALSSLTYRHLELKEMSHEYCLRYIDRLLSYLEQSSDYREKYRKVLVKALDDPLVAKLMTTPLYTAILVLLVKSGATPPTRRYELFQKYCDIVQQRELQKELLPRLYEGDYAWIKEIHGMIAYLLQSESETAENAAAELSIERCRGLISAYLDEEKWKANKKEKEDELYHAITERLPFLAETTDADNNCCVLFPLRSLQEYFAAEHLLRIEDQEKRREMLEALSFNAYWRNVFLFVAGFYSQNNSQSINDSIYAICMKNNGDARFEDGAQVACKIALPGSWLALDLLRDNLFERRGGQERYIELAAELLNEEYTSGSPVPTFMKLPLVLRERFTRDFAIPRVYEKKNPNEAAFELLIRITKSEIIDAKECLESLAGQLTLPKPATVFMLLTQDSFCDFGVKLAHRLFEWISNDYVEWLSLYRIETWEFLEYYSFMAEWKSLPNTVRRLIVYDILGGYHFDDKLPPFSNTRSLIDHDEMLSSAIRVRRNGNSRGSFVKNTWFIYDLPENAGEWFKLCKIFKREGFMELAALGGFLCEPTIKMLKELLNASQNLPENLRKRFNFVLNRQTLLLRIFADKAITMEKFSDFLIICNEAFFQSVCELEQRIMEALSRNDYVALNELDAWPYLNLRYIDNEPWLPVIISTASDLSCKSILSALSWGAESKILTDDLRCSILQRFPLAFHSWSGERNAILAFSQETIEKLARKCLSYPSSLLQKPYLFNIGDRTTVSNVIERIQALSALGGAYLNVYSLVPSILRDADCEILRGLSQRAIEQFDVIKGIGNIRAMYGSILLILTGDIPDNKRTELFDELCRLLKGVDLFIFDGYLKQFSLEGKLLVHEAGMTAYHGTKQETLFYSTSRSAILKSLEALPIDRSKLPMPGISLISN